MNSNFSQRHSDINAARLKLRAQALTEFLRAPTKELSEVIRLIDVDILFWEELARSRGHSVDQLINTVSTAAAHCSDPDNFDRIPI